MNNKETKKAIIAWTKRENGVLSWPTDGCGYDQHIKFVHHRNRNWNGGDFNQFVIDYANSLVEEKEESK